MGSKWSKARSGRYRLSLLGSFLKKKMSQIPTPIMPRHEPLKAALSEGGYTQYPEGELHVPGNHTINDRTVPRTKRKAPRIIIETLTNEIEVNFCENVPSSVLILPGMLPKTLDDEDSF